MRGLESDLFEAGNPKNENGVLKRFDGSGDLWATLHRKRVEKQYMLTDVDGLFGAMFFAKNTTDQLWMEYVNTDPSKLAMDSQRFGVTGIFERKAFLPEEGHARRNSYLIQRQFYCWHARALASVQGVPPKLLYVLNSKRSGTFRMYEVDIDQEALTGRKWWLDGQCDWMKIWDAAGLVDVRQQLLESVAPRG